MDETLWRQMLGQLQRGRLMLVLGADLPIELTGLPSRIDLARGLAAEYGLAASSTLASVAEQVAVGSSFLLLDYLGRALDTLGKQPQPLHHQIAHIPFSAIVTTAYDDLLERAFQEERQPLERVVQPNDLPFAGMRQAMLIKLYGELRQRTTMVISRSDQAKLWLDPARQPLLEAVRSLLRQNSALLIGHDLGDPDFLLLWQSIVLQHGAFSVGAFAIVPGLPEAERRVWQERQIRFLDIQPLALLERLAAATARRDVLKPEGDPPPPPSPGGHPSAEEINNQQMVLQAHRRTLAAFLQRAALLGSAHVPPEVSNGIYDARREIERIKAVLRGWGVASDDYPDDRPPPQG